MSNFSRIKNRNRWLLEKINSEYVFEKEKYFFSIIGVIIYESVNWN